ncbi:raptor N-terminal caspase like domain-containing protein [Syncephalis fuscata]|nr:raptor N-terminal caspase like domain-containing protein [Syncephalis fuscata]
MAGAGDLNVDDTVTQLLDGYSYLYFAERRHDSQGDMIQNGLWITYLCLNIGIDPPDVVKTSPCARLECWIDPYAMSSQRALDTIGHTLKQQYEVLQSRARYKLLLDPAVEAAKKLCCALRRSTREDRILFHYNGHGVPKPTTSGEIWVFNKSYTQYIPVSLYDLQSWLGSPCIYVYDCSAAGNIVAAFDKFARQRDAESEKRRQSGGQSLRTPGTFDISTAPMSDCIQLAACSANEVLPMNPTLPADLFSACLTTPIPMALRWFVLQSPILGVNISPDDVMKLPGRYDSRRTPLGELSWILTAVTDTIAWNVLPLDLFKRLFRQDIMVAGMFRNFLLADRIMRHYKCTPVSRPALPPTHQHPMWQAWDLAVDMCVMQIPALLEATQNETPLQYRPSTFFADQLTAFEVWLKHGQVTRQPPEQLPIILQVLLSQVHRMRALVLLSRFLDLGAWAVNLALSVGIFPYVLKLLQSPVIELRPVLIFIWARMLAVDHDCAQDLTKENGYLYFVNVLSPSQPTPPQQQVAASLSEHRAMCAFVISIFCRHADAGRRACLNAGVIAMCVAHTESPDHLLRQWCCLCLGQLWRGFPDAQWTAIRDNVHERLLDMLEDAVPEVRAAALYALSTLVGDLDLTEQLIHTEHNIAVKALTVSEDASPLVRRELVCLLSAIIHRYPEQFLSVASSFLEESRHWSSPGSLGTNAAMFDDKTWRRRKDRSRTKPSDSIATAFNALINGSADTNGNGGRTTQDLMYGCVWYPYAPVAISASAVVDYVHDQLYDSGQVMAVLSSIPGSPASVRSLNLPPSTVSGTGGINGNSGINSGFDKRSSPATQRITTSLKRSASGTMSAIRNFYNFGYGLTSGFNNAPPHQTATPSNTPSTATSNKHGASRSHSESGSRDFYHGRPTSEWLWDAPNAGTAATTYNIPRRQASSRPWSTIGNISTTSLNELNSKIQPETNQLFDWCCTYFLEPQIRTAENLEPGSEGYNARSWRRTRNERVLQETVPLHEESANATWDKSYGLLNEETSAQLLRFHTYEPHLLTSDGQNTISIWDWERHTKINAFWNGNTASSRITSIDLMNEEDVALLMVGSDDGAIRLYRNYESSSIELVSSWRALVDRLPSNCSSGLITNWQQISGTLLVGGDARVVRVWNAEREFDIFTHSDSCVTSLTSHPMSNNLFIAGCGDGVVRVFDRRNPPRENLVITWNEHPGWILGVCQQQNKQHDIVSASVAGDIKIWDIRQTDSVLTIDADVEGLTAFSVHNHAPVMASSGSRGVTIWNLFGEMMGMPRIHGGMLGQRLGPPNALAYHPRRPLLALGGTDRPVSIIGCEMRKPLLQESLVSTVRMIDA